jgi:dTDP-4-dehydrorhamnose reductase
MWQYCSGSALPQEELEWFWRTRVPPDIVGINHYLTSERFLDENLAGYQSIRTAATVTRIRRRRSGARLQRRHRRPMVLLWEAWQRYGIPIAVTEAHLGCTREEQMRWLDEVWQAARTLRGNGVDIRAVTAWTLLGAYDWHCLLTRCEGHYEPGVFDLRGPEPRPTALATQ